VTTCKQCGCTVDASCDLDGLAFCGDECVFRYAMALDVMKPPIGEIRVDSLVRSKLLSPKALSVFQEGLAQARAGEFVEGPDVAADLAEFADDLDYVIDKNRELYDKLAKPEDPPMPPPDRSPAEWLAVIHAVLVDHWGSAEIADAWLDTPWDGYRVNARTAIDEGYGSLVWEDLQVRWGDFPPYA
jgi:uncharacterized protein YbjT (DUF2867 family)